MPSAGGPGGGGIRIEVDPQVLIIAGTRLGAIGAQLGMLSDAATPIFNTGIASGLDPAGLNFGLEYSDLARQLAPGLADAANAGKSLGRMLEASGYNYRNADAASTIGGSGAAGGVSGELGDTISASVPSGPNGIFVAPPVKWALVYPFIQMFGGLGAAWPSGHPALMGLLAAQWENIATGLDAVADDIAAITTAVSGQHIPEGDAIGARLFAFDTNLSVLATDTRTLATSIKDFADGVQDTQDAIRRLLDRVSLDGLIDTVTGFFTGEGDDILREVGRDIGQLLENFQSQVKAVVGLLGQLAGAIGDAATALQDLIRPFLVATFGEDVGNALATTFDTYTDFQVGLVTGLINTVAGTVAFADADTWKGIAETARQVAEDPTKLDDVLVGMGKQFIAYDQITGENPARGLGEAAFNVGSLFVPGGALSKTGTLAKGIGYTTRLVDEGRLPRLSDLPGVGGNQPGPGLPPPPEVRPGPIPDSLIGPLPPGGIDPPVTPPGTGAPGGGPPDPPGPTTTPGGGDSGSGGGGGDGPPPDSGGRPVGPPEAAPGPSTQSPVSPTSSGPGSVDGPGVSEPSAPPTPSSSGDVTPPATPHSPESSSPAGTPEPVHLPSESGASMANQAPPTPDTHGNGSPTEHRQPTSNGDGGRPDVGTDTHASQQPAHSPVAEQPATHDRSATDGSPTREQTQTSGIAATPMAGMPMALHAPAGVHSPAGGPDPGRTPSSEAHRSPDGKVAQAGSPESPRTQAPVGAGPGMGNAPGAPVSAAAGHTAAIHGDNPANPQTEPAKPIDAPPSQTSDPGDRSPAEPRTGDEAHAEPADRADIDPDASDPISQENPADHSVHQMLTPDAILNELRPWDVERVERAIEADGVAQDLHDHNAPPAVANSALENPYAGMSPTDIIERYWDPERNTWDWPPDSGFRNGNYDTAPMFPEDLVLDRIGLVEDWTGDFLSSAGDSYPSRALAPGTSGDYHTFQGTGVPLPPEWELRFGEAGPAFDQPGGSTQWVVVDQEGNHVLINQLVNEGYLTRIPRES